jgi:hypothetical protein
MADNNDPNQFSRPIQLGLFIVAGLGVICAILHIFLPDRLGLDENTAMFLALAVVALTIQQITKFKGFGIEFEKEVKQLKSDVKSVELSVGNLEKGVGPGSKSAIAPAAAATPELAKAASIGAPPVNPSDPNKGQFGGAPEVNGRKLTAKVVPDGGPRSSRCRVEVEVISTDPGRPLTGKVKLYLHPTFGRWSSYELQVNKAGVAEDDIVSYGAFTIGAETDGGKTRLELDLMDVPGGTKRFYDE